MLEGRTPQAQQVARTATAAAAFALAVFASFALLAPDVRAQGLTGNELLSNEVGEAIGTGTTDIRITIARIIRVALGLLGTVALLIILYAGWLWMTAAGDEEKVGRAKKTLSAGVIGLVIILSAFAIVQFILSRLIEATGEGPLGGSSAPLDVACIGLTATCPAGALGGGFLESHYPQRNATGIPRNTRIAVTFKGPIDPATVTVGPEGTVAILKSADVGGTGGPFPTRFADSLTADDIEVVATADARTFVFMQKNCPTDCLGSPSENVFYTVALRGGNEGIKKADGSAAFGGTFNSGYLWEFQTSTVLDLTPPKVRSVLPPDGSTDNPRNSMLQVVFDEAVDPVSAQAGFSVVQSGGRVIQGTQLIGNGYRTLEFRTDDLCGTNSCGEPVYCLPGNETITVTVRSDGLTATPPTGIFPPNGITDMAGNSLDGDGDGTAEGPPTDDRAFTFGTNDEIDLVPPKVTEHEPGILTGNIPRDLRMTATFSKLMSASSFTTDSMRLIPGAGGAPTNYWLAVDNLEPAGGGEPDRSRGTIHHDLLSENQPYSSDLTSGLRDLRQNCFYPGGGQTVCTGDEPYCCNGIPSQVACSFLP